MRNILTKFKINVATYIFFFLSFLCGYFKNVLFIFFIVFIHELGHVFVIKLCKYKILSVEFYPFGGITKIDKPINSSINKELLISSAGLVFQLVLACIAYVFRDSFRDYEIFQLYNLSIFIFNLLPIIPLDGSIFVHSLFEKWFSYEKAFRLYKILSLLAFSVFFGVNIFFHLNNFFICGVLLCQFFLLKKQEKYFLHRFYLERYLNNYPYRQIKNHTKGSIKDLQKETKHYFLRKNRYLSEHEMIDIYFKKG